MTAPVLLPADVVTAAARFRLARAIAAAAELDLASQLSQGARSPGDLAAAVGAGELPLAMLLRALASEGVFAEDAQGRFALNDAALALLPAAAGGSREVILGWVGHPAVYRAMERVGDAVRSGRSAFEVVHGTGFFEWLAEHPNELEQYMSAVGGDEPEEFATLIDILGLDGVRTLADIGGGGGGLLRVALGRHPLLRGMLIDLPQVADRATNALMTAGMADRITVHAADCRVSVPPGADCYAMSTVLRYFSDDVAVAVLRNVHAAIAVGVGSGSIVLVEMPLPAGPAEAPSAMKSFVEFCLSGGRDRSLTELAALLAAAGFRDAVDTHWEGPYWVTRAIAG